MSTGLRSLYNSQNKTRSISSYIVSSRWKKALYISSLHCSAPLYKTRLTAHLPTCKIQRIKEDSLQVKEKKARPSISKKQNVSKVAPAINKKLTYILTTLIMVVFFVTLEWYGIRTHWRDCLMWIAQSDSRWWSKEEDPARKKPKRTARLKNKRNVHIRLFHICVYRLSDKWSWLFLVPALMLSSTLAVTILSLSAVAVTIC